VNKLWLGVLCGLAVVVGCHHHDHAATDAAVDAETFFDAPIDAPVAPVFRNPVTGSDATIAQQALAILGAQVSGANPASCNSCHGMTRQHLRYWRALGDTSMATCLTDLHVATQPEAVKMLDCLRATPAMATSPFQPQKLGIYASAARLPWFDYVFTLAYGAQAQAQKDAFIQLAAMPHGSTVTPLTQDQFDIVAEWMARGEPMIDDLLPPDGQPTNCTAGVSADVATHTAQLSTTGWRSVNHDAMMAMFDCGTATDPRNCLSHQALASTKAYGVGWDVTGLGHWRVLDDITYQSAYWSRSSPDGRFIAHGGGSAGGSTIIDLQRGVHIAVNAAYDPAFFPDNSGFMFQGASSNSCPLSVLTSNPTQVTMTEPGCASLGVVGLYQHLGKALGGGDYFTINGQFVSDNGGHYQTLGNPDAYFDSASTNHFTPVIFDGTSYTAGTQVSALQPYEGDAVMSPSATLELTRVAGATGQIGYVLHKVVATHSGASYTLATPEIARYCLSGGKPAFSYDERWIVYHHYVTAADAVELGFTGPSDPSFAPYLQKGAANIYLMDLATGQPKRITNMPAGQYAVMPHFRSDGWIYADVRDSVLGHEYFVASDAALIAEQ
jgi:hypothetical protein